MGKEELLKLAEPLKKNEYGQYLIRLAKQEAINNYIKNKEVLS